MAMSPYEVLTNNSPLLVKQVLDQEANFGIGRFLYNLFAGITIEACDKKASIQDIQVKEVTLDNNNRLLKILVSYPSGISEPVELKLLFERNYKIARVLELNSDIRGLALRVCEVLKGWAIQKGIPLSEVVILNERIPRGSNYIIADVRTLQEYDRAVSEQFDKQEQGVVLQ